MNVLVSDKNLKNFDYFLHPLHPKPNHCVNSKLNKFSYKKYKNAVNIKVTHYKYYKTIRKYDSPGDFF